MSGIRLILTLLLLWIFTRQSVAQEMHGLVNSNYAGILGNTINPTSILNSKLFLDIVPFGLHLNVDNNYIYIAKEDYKFSRFFTPGAEFPVHGEDDRVFYDNFNFDLKNVYSEVKVIGPSVMFAHNDQAFGFSTAFRNIASGRNIPYEIAKFGVEGLNYTPLQRINFTNGHSFRAADIAFTEIAATYSRVLVKRNRDHWSAGITLKGLLGNAGMYGTVDNIDYMVPNGDTLIVYNINGEMGLSLPVDYYNNDVLVPDKLFYGSGLGVDLGITYQLKVRGHSNKGYSMPCEYPYEPYYYRVGLSLIDIGRIKFKSNTRSMDLIDQDAYWFDISRNSFTNIDKLLKTASYEFSGDSTALIRENAFSIWLPAAMSIQADFRVNKAIFINATMVQPLILSKAQPVRPSQISITPRWESDYLEFALPFILYDYKYPRLGASLRIRNLVIGTDKLAGFFGYTDFYGLDFYVMLRFGFLKGECRNFDKKVGCGNLEYKHKN